MRRHKWKLLALAGLAALAAGAFVLWPRPDRLTRENIDRIRVGMSRAELEALLGPPGDYRVHEVEFHCVGMVYVLARGHTTVSWIDDKGSFFVEFDPSDHVVLRDYCPGRVIDPSAMGSLRWRFKRQWESWFP